MDFGKEGKLGMSSEKLRVAIYARISTRDQNPALQLDELRHAALQRGWVVEGEYVDLGQSGAKRKRPELDRMIKQVHRGKVDIVCCWRFDRFARSVKHLVEALEDFRARGVDFVSLNDGVDTTTPAGRFSFHIFAAVAELEREILKERVKAGMDAARRRGEKIGRPRVRVDVARALSLRAGGMSYRKIATTLGVGAGTVHRAIKESRSHVPQGPVAEASQQIEINGTKAA